MPYIYSAKTPSCNILCDMASTYNMPCVASAFSSSASEIKVGLGSVELPAEGDDNAEDQLSTAPPSLSGDVAIVLQDAGDVESECIPQSRIESRTIAGPTIASATRWADMSDEEVDAMWEETLLSKREGPQSSWADTLSQRASRVYDHSTTPSSSSSPSCHGHGAPSTDAAADSAYSAQEWEEVGETSGWRRQLPQTERGMDSGGKNRFSKGLTKGAGKGSGKLDAKGFEKGDTKGGRKSGKGKNSGRGSKCQCQYTIGIEEETGFRVCNKLLGPKGQHMKAIAEATGAKLRLRGLGSKFLEAPDWVESSDPLMLCLSAPDATEYAEAKRLTEEVLEDVYKQFRRFQATKGLTPENVSLDVHEGPREGSF